MSRESSRAGASSQASRRVAIEAVLARFDSLRVLVVGDLLLDDYRLGDVERISPEAPVPVVRVQTERSELGGAGNVARGLVALGAEALLVSVAGTDAEGDRAVDLLGAAGISSRGIVRTPGRATPHKMRIVARGQQMLRIDREESAALSPECDARLREAISRAIDGSDIVVLEDYDKGLFADGLATWVIALADERGIPVAADPKHDLGRFRGASLVKPNLQEANAFVPGESSDFESRRVLLEKIQRELAGAEIVLTRGARGMTALDREGVATEIATQAVEIFDVQGAGDTSIAALALCRAVGADLVDACIVANAAASVVVEKRGTAAVALEELRSRLPETIAAFAEDEEES